MKVSIFGAGYVGLVTGICFAKLGHELIIVDIDETKIARLIKGELPIFEPELEAMFLDTNTLRFTNDAVAAVSHAEIIFIAVNGPNFVYQVAYQIAALMTTPKTIVIKSTVP